MDGQEDIPPYRKKQRPKSLHISTKIQNGTSSPKASPAKTTTSASTSANTPTTKSSNKKPRPSSVNLHALHHIDSPTRSRQQRRSTTLRPSPRGQTFDSGVIATRTGGSPKKKNEGIKGKGKSPVHVEFFAAVFRGKAEEVTQFLLTDPSLAHATNTLDRTQPLHHAASGGNVDSIQVLLDCGADIDARDAEGFTPLHLAALRGKRAAAIELVKNDAQINFDDGTPSVVSQAVIKGDPNLVAFLLSKGAKCAADSMFKETPIHIAASLGYKRTLEVLLSSSNFLANIDAKAKKQNATALHYAASKNRPQCVTVLVAAGANVNMKDSNGRTALHRAAMNGHIPVIDALIECNAKPDVTDKEGMTPLHLAINARQFEIAKKIIASGAGTSVGIADKKGSYPLHYACKTGSLPMIKLLVQQGAKTNVQDTRGIHPLDIVSQLGFNDLASYLVASGADVSLLYTNNNRINSHKSPPKIENLDEFGFILDDPMSKRLLLLSQPETIKPKHVKKTQKILTDFWGKKHAKHVKSLRKKILNDEIPRSVRGNLWRVILDLDNTKKQQPQCNYADLVNTKIDPKDLWQIHRDIERTLINHRHFCIKFSDGQIQLFRILRAFAAYDEKIGYVQSMSTIAGILLLILQNEEDVFWALVVLFRKNFLHNVYEGNLNGLRNVVFPMWDGLLQEYFPHLLAHLKEIEIQANYYIPNWFLVILFGHIPFVQLLRLWDLFILDGYPILFSFGLSIFSLSEDKVIKYTDFEDFNDFKLFPTQGLNEDKLFSLTCGKFHLNFDKISNITNVDINVEEI